MRITYEYSLYVNAICAAALFHPVADIIPYNYKNCNRAGLLTQANQDATSAVD